MKRKGIEEGHLHCGFHFRFGVPYFRHAPLIPFKPHEFEYDILESASKSSAAKRNSQKGQVLIEAVLLLVLMVGLWGAFSRYAKQQKWFESVVGGPWQSMRGMIENGVWDEPKKAQAKHPNNFNRVVSLLEQ